MAKKKQPTLSDIMGEESAITMTATEVRERQAEHAKEHNDKVTKGMKKVAEATIGKVAEILVKNMNQVPSIGRIVHYCAAKGELPEEIEIYPAIIVKVTDPSVSLMVIKEGFSMFMKKIPHSENYEAGFYSWPPKI